MFPGVGSRTQGGVFVPGTFGPGARKAIRGAGEPQVLAQRAAFVLRTKKPSPAQLGNDEIHEVVQSARQVRWHDVESVRAFVQKPLFQKVGDGGRSSDDLAVAPRSRDPLVKLPDGQTLALGQIDEQLLAALPAVRLR